MFTKTLQKSKENLKPSQVVILYTRVIVKNEAIKENDQMKKKTLSLLLVLVLAMTSLVAGCAQNSKKKALRRMLKQQ